MYRKFCLCLIVLNFMPTLSIAQQSAEFTRAFAGDWISYSQDYSDDGPCRISITDQPVTTGHRVQTADCRGTLAHSAAWKIDQSQIVLLSSDGTVLFRLGGSPAVLSGESQSRATPLVIERAAPAKARYAQRKSNGCSYLGYSQTCAEPEQYAPPQSAGQLRILVDLNGRAEPRDDAAVLQVLPEASCVRTEVCTQSSGGLWCQVNTETAKLWVRKQAHRQDNWPIMTFLSGC